MNAECPERRLCWDGRRGFALLGERSVELRAAPPLTGMAVDRIDFAPADHCFEILRRGEARREMFPGEIREAESLLATLTAEVNP